jgi:hypothetical protein
MSAVLSGLASSTSGLASSTSGLASSTGGLASSTRLPEGNTDTLQEAAAIQGDVSQNKEVKGIRSQLQEEDELDRNKENIDKDKKSSISPIYLLSSTSGHIKLQMGGRIFSNEEVMDPLQETNPVHNQVKNWKHVTNVLIFVSDMS